MVAVFYMYSSSKVMTSHEKGLCTHTAS